MGWTGSAEIAFTPTLARFDMWVAIGQVYVDTTWQLLPRRIGRTRVPQPMRSPGDFRGDVHMDREYLQEHNVNRASAPLAFSERGTRRGNNLLGAVRLLLTCNSFRFGVSTLKHVQ